MNIYTQIINKVKEATTEGKTINDVLLNKNQIKDLPIMQEYRNGTNPDIDIFATPFGMVNIIEDDNVTEPVYIYDDKIEDLLPYDFGEEEEVKSNVIHLNVLCNMDGSVMIRKEENGKCYIHMEDHYGSLRENDPLSEWEHITENMYNELIFLDQQ